METPEGFRTRFVDLPELRMHVAEAGPEDGEPVILLHGFPEFWYTWRHQMRALADAGYRAIAPDQRGYNLTEKRGPYHARRLSQDICDLQDALGIAACPIVGHDWGGAISWSFAALYPERASKLVALNAPHPQSFQDACKRGLTQLRKSWYMFYFQLPWLPEFTIRSGDFKKIRGHFAELPGETMTPEDIERYVEALRQPGALSAALGWYRAIPGQLTGEMPPNDITVPTCVIWGEQDVALDKICCDTLPDYVADLRLHFLPNSTHWVQIDDPDAVNRHLLAFLAE